MTEFCEFGSLYDFLHTLEYVVRVSNRSTTSGTCYLYIASLHWLSLRSLIASRHHNTSFDSNNGLSINNRLSPINSLSPNNSTHRSSGLSRLVNLTETIQQSSVSSPHLHQSSLSPQSRPTSFHHKLNQNKSYSSSPRLASESEALNNGNSLDSFIDVETGLNVENPMIIDNAVNSSNSTVTGVDISQLPTPKAHHLSHEVNRRYIENVGMSSDMALNSIENHFYDSSNESLHSTLEKMVCSFMLLCI